MREGVFQVGGCGSRFDSHLHFPTHQRSVVQMDLGSSVFNQTTSTLLLPRGESKIPNSSRLNQHQGAAQVSKLLSAETSWEKAAGGKAGKGYSALRDPEPGPTRPCRVTGAPWTAALLVTCGYCYSLASRRRAGWDRAWIQRRNGWHIHWHTSLSGQTLGGCSTSKGSSSKTVCCA